MTSILLTNNIYESPDNGVTGAKKIPAQPAVESSVMMQKMQAYQRLKACLRNNDCRISSNLKF